MGNHPFTNLFNAEITTGRKVNELSPDSFRQLSQIARLELSNAGIDAIIDGTFDRIGKTLRILDLSKNWIIIIIPVMFNVFMSSEKVNDSHLQ